MYQTEVKSLRDDIIKNKPFEACVTLDSRTSGIIILGVKKVPNSRGLHCVFVDLEEYRGNEYYCFLNSQFRFNFTKPGNEVGCHLPMGGGSYTLQLKSEKGDYSQIIGGLNFNHTNAGHSSYYVYAIKSISRIDPIPVDSEAKRLIKEIETNLNRLKEII